ncbi:MAG: winged helix-turn-helix domain-containing protein [Pseudomonadota bacterium]
MDIVEVVRLVGHPEMETGLVLIADSNPITSKSLEQQLTNAGYRTYLATNFSEAVDAVENMRPQLLLLEPDLDDRSGLDLTEAIRRDPVNSSLGIIMQGVKADESLRIAALDRGVDDFIARTLSEKEFLARIKATLRRVNNPTTENRVQVGSLVLDIDSYLVTLDGELLNFGPTEFRLLKFLMTHPNKVHSRNDLLKRVWNSDGTVGRRTVDVHVRRLRSALEHRGYDVLIQTVTGVGYRFMADALDNSHQSVTLDS